MGVYSPVNLICNLGQAYIQPPGVFEPNPQKISTMHTCSSKSIPRLFESETGTRNVVKVELEMFIHMTTGRVWYTR
jgi:hypothetical protein